MDGKTNIGRCKVSCGDALPPHVMDGYHSMDYSEREYMDFLAELTSTGKFKLNNIPCDNEVTLDFIGRQMQISDGRLKQKDRAGAQVFKSALIKSPYLFYFWKNQTPKPQKLYICTGSIRFGPVLMSALKHENMSAMCVVVRTVYGTEFHLVENQESKSSATRIAFANFLRNPERFEILYKSKVLAVPYKNASDPDCAIELEELVDEVFSNVQKIDEKNLFVMKILKDLEFLPVKTNCTFDVEISSEDLPGAAKLLSSGIFGVPVQRSQIMKTTSPILNELGISFKPRVNVMNNIQGQSKAQQTTRFEECRVNAHIYEIINTEKNYRNRLVELRDYFYKPALENLDQTDFINANFAKRCMPDPTPIIQICDQIIEGVKMGLESSKVPNLPDTKRFLEVFEKVFSSKGPESISSVYGKFFNRFEESVALFSEYTSKNEKFFSKCCAKYYEAFGRNVSISSLRIEPIQRICRYTMLFSTLLKLIPKDHEYYPYASRAERAVADFGIAMQNEEEQISRGKMLSAIDEEFRLDGALFSIHSQYVSELLAVSVVPHERNSGTYALLLFSQSLLIAKRNEGRLKTSKIYQSEYIFDLSEMTIINWIDCEFILSYNDGTVYRFRASSKKAKEEFLETLMKQKYISLSESRMSVPCTIYHKKVNRYQFFYRVMSRDGFAFEVENDRTRGSAVIIVHSYGEKYCSEALSLAQKFYDVVGVIDTKPDDTLRMNFCASSYFDYEDNSKDESSKKSVLNLKDSRQAYIELFNLGRNYLNFSQRRYVKSEVERCCEVNKIILGYIVYLCDGTNMRHNKPMTIKSGKSRRSIMSTRSVLQGVNRRFSVFAEKIGKICRPDQLFSIDENKSFSGARNKLKTTFHVSNLGNAKTASLFGYKKTETRITSSAPVVFVEPRNDPNHLVCDALNLDIGHCLKVLVEYVEKNGKKCEGVYRKQGTQSLCYALYNDLCSCTTEMALKDGSFDLDTITTIIKRILKSFFTDQPLVSNYSDIEKLSEVIERIQSSNNQEYIRKDWLQEIMDILNLDHDFADDRYRISALIMSHLLNISELSSVNLMSICNLVTIFTPAILPWSELGINYDKIPAVLKFLIVNSGKIFRKDTLSNNIGSTESLESDESPNRLSYSSDKYVVGHQRKASSDLRVSPFDLNMGKDSKTSLNELIMNCCANGVSVKSFYNSRMGLDSDYEDQTASVKSQDNNLKKETRCVQRQVVENLKRPEAHSEVHKSDVVPLEKCDRNEIEDVDSKIQEYNNRSDNKDFVDLAIINYMNGDDKLSNTRNVKVTSHDDSLEGDHICEDSSVQKDEDKITSNNFLAHISIPNVEDSVQLCTDIHDPTQVQSSKFDENVKLQNIEFDQNEKPLIDTGYGGKSNVDSVDTLGTDYGIYWNELDGRSFSKSEKTSKTFEYDTDRPESHGYNIEEYEPRYVHDDLSIMQYEKICRSKNNSDFERCKNEKYPTYSVQNSSNELKFPRLNELSDQTYILDSSITLANKDEGSKSINNRFTKSETASDCDTIDSKGRERTKSEGYNQVYGKTKTKFLPIKKVGFNPISYILDKLEKKYLNV